MSKFEVDFFVIGAGSGGVRAARMAAGFGARVAVAEDRYFGGTCVNVGCIPKKLFVYASRVSEDLATAPGYGWTVPGGSFDWPTLVRNKDTEIARLNGVYRRVLEGAGCEIVEGRATLIDPHTVEIAGRRVTAAHILVATGGWPSVPRFPGREHVMTSNEIFHLARLPRRMVVVGGGYIAVEFAGILHGLGCEVTQLYRGELFLRGFDREIRSFLAEQMRHKGIDLRFDADVARIEKAGETLNVTLKDGTTLACDGVLYATGRHPNSANLGLEACGVKTDAVGAIVVDEAYSTNVPSIHAVGDVTNRVNLTPVALAEGMALARRLFGGKAYALDYDYIPSAVFSQPPIGTVGLTEDEAQQRYGALDIYTSSFTPLRYTISPVKEKAFMKLIVEKAGQRVVGLHLCGEDAGEITQGFAVAMRAGATKQVFDATIGIHPTAAEEFVTMREPTRST
ncbi:MAG: glutathione-disulfide reductase [Gammaproteobacteria bacterium]